MMPNATACTPIVQRNACGTKRSTRPDLICDASAMPAMNASSGQTWLSAAAHLPSDVSIAQKMTLAVWTLANTPPRAM